MAAGLRLGARAGPPRKQTSQLCPWAGRVRSPGRPLPRHYGSLGLREAPGPPLSELVTPGCALGQVQPDFFPWPWSEWATGPAGQWYFGRGLVGQGQAGLGSWGLALGCIRPQPGPPACLPGLWLPGCWGLSLGMLTGRRLQPWPPQAWGLGLGGAVGGPGPAAPTPHTRSSRRETCPHPKAPPWT